MSIKSEIKSYLEEHPMAREQKWINQATWGFLSRKYGFNEAIPKELYFKIGTKFDSVRRLIDKIQEENEHLRGKDWEGRRVREQKKQLELGVVEIGYHQNIKKLQTI